MATNSSQKIDRQTTTPFLLKLFYKTGGFYRPEEFSPHNTQPPPAHVQIYTWQSCSLRELTHLLTTALPDLLPSPSIGTRLSFRLIFPDTRSAHVPANSNAPGRYLSKDLGSVILGEGGPGVPGVDEDGNASSKLGGEADRTLQDARFVIGDFISVAIFPPHADGSVAPAPPAQSSYSYRPGPPPRAGGTTVRENGYSGGSNFSGSYGSGYGRSAGPRRYEPYRGSGPSGGVPIGEWRRGEIPGREERPYGGRSRGRGRGY